jgi:hypothetical protein
MFYSALEPEVNDDEFVVDEVVEHICPKFTFALIGKKSDVIIDNAATAASIAPDTESPIEVFFAAEAFKFFRARYEKHPTMKFTRCRQIAENSFTGDHTLLMHQYSWRNYRIDWVIKVTFLKQPYFFIECDGQESSIHPNGKFFTTGKKMKQ